jgi:hypothetical protein
MLMRDSDGVGDISMSRKDWRDLSSQVCIDHAAIGDIRHAAAKACACGMSGPSTFADGIGLYTSWLVVMCAPSAMTTLHGVKPQFVRLVPRSA